MPSPDSFVQRWLGPLLDYDTEHRSDLVRTLSTYLRSAGDVNTTAAKLVIHPSTARYRMGLIRQLTGLDLHDRNNHQHLVVATDTWMRRNGSH